MKYIIESKYNVLYIIDEFGNDLYEELNSEWWLWDYDEFGNCLSEVDSNKKWWTWEYENGKYISEKHGKYEDVAPY